MLVCGVASVLVAGVPLSSTGPITDVPFELYQDYLVVAKGSLRGLNGLNVLIDTGTIPSVVDARIARKLHLRAEPSVLVAFGQQVRAQSVVLQGLRIGAVESGSIRTGVGDLSYLVGVRVDPIIGLDVLARSNFSIDYRTRMLTFGPRRTRGRRRAVGNSVAVRDGDDDDRRRTGAAAGRHRQP